MCIVPFVLHTLAHRFVTLTRLVNMVSVPKQQQKQHIGVLIITCHILTHV